MNAGEQDELGLVGVVNRNIAALLTRRRQEERARGLQDRIADAIARFAGSMPFVYLHLLIYGSWIVINLPWLPSLPKFDRSYTILAMVASVEAIFLSTFVLINQNRMQAMADRRADLDLQISLLGEHEITRLIQLASAIARRLGLDEAQNPELAELSQDIAPEKVMDKLDEQAEEHPEP